MTFDFVIGFVFDCSAVVLLLMCLMAINRMTLTTNHWIRASVVMMAVGAFGELCLSLWAAPPTFSETLVNAGMAIGLLANRRTQP